MPVRSRIYLGRIPRRAAQRDVERFFKGYGKIVDIQLKNGFGFVDFDDPRDAEDATYDLNGKEMCGERVIVELARGTPHGRDLERCRESGGGSRRRSRSRSRSRDRAPRRRSPSPKRKRSPPRRSRTRSRSRSPRDRDGDRGSKGRATNGDAKRVSVERAASGDRDHHSKSRSRSASPVADDNGHDGHNEDGASPSGH